jgi:uncharacterized membrane protein YfcA
MITSFLIGLLAGGFGGLVGLGGGVFIIALTVRYFKFTQIQAHATALMGLTFTGLAGALTYYLHGSVNITAAVCLASAAIITARFGALYAHALPEWQLKRAFGIFLICISALLLAKPYIAHLAVLSHPAATWVKIVALVGSGAVAGFIGGMMGVGGGSIMIPAMVLVVGLSQYTAQGTSLLAIAPIGMMGAFTHWRLGNVVLRVLPGLIVGVILGSFLSGSLAHFLSQGELRLVFAGVLTWMGIRNIRAALKLKAAPASSLSHA